MMRDSLSILTSSTVLPPSATAPRPRRRRHHSTFNTTTKPKPKPNPKPIPQFTPTPLLSSSRLDNRRSLRYYTDLSSKLAEDGRFADFLMIAESVVASGVNVSELLPLLNAKSVASGIARAVREGKLGSVVEVLFNGVVKLGIEPLQLLDGAALESLRGECQRLLKCAEVEPLVSLMENLAGFQFPIKELVKPSDVIRLCVNKRSPNAATRYAQISPHVEFLTCSIILEFGKERDLMSALAVFDASKQNSSSPNMHAYRTIIDVCGLCGDYLKSRSIYEELLVCNVTPNTYVFNSVMNVNACDLNYTLDIYKQMEKLGVAADITSYNILIKSCCLAAKVERAQDIYREIRRLESKGELKLDVFTYSTMIKVLADANMWRQALEIKEDMVASGVIPDTVTWSSLISACAHAGLVEQAIKLFDDMLQAGVQPNARCFNILLHACTEACQYDRAFRLFRCWKEFGFQRIITYDIQRNLDEFVASDQMKIAHCVSTPSPHLPMSVPFRPTTSTYNILMKACGTDYYRAKALMDEMSSLGLSPNHISWSTLIDVCGGSGNVAGAVQILRSMREAGIQPDVIAYTTAIKICVEHGNPKGAFSLFAEMKKYQIKPNMVTYNTIFKARTRYGSLQEVQQCLSVYQDMRNAGYKPNDYYLKQLIEEWCEGVIKKRHKKTSQSTSRRTDFGPQNLLLEKVAEHLQDSNAKSLSIDLRGLTMLEARIVILAVLRKIKEKYIAGHQVKDDMLIILGVVEASAHVTKNGRGGVEEAVIRLLQHDLGLQVLSASSSVNSNREKGKPDYSTLMLEEVVHTSGSSQAPGSPARSRRPAVLQRLRVTRESLHHWLQRKNIGASTQ